MSTFSAGGYWEMDKNLQDHITIKSWVAKNYPAMPLGRVHNTANIILNYVSSMQHTSPLDTDPGDGHNAYVAIGTSYEINRRGKEMMTTNSTPEAPSQTYQRMLQLERRRAEAEQTIQQVNREMQ